MNDARFRTIAVATTVALAALLGSGGPAGALSGVPGPVSDVTDHASTLTDSSTFRESPGEPTGAVGLGDADAEFVGANRSDLAGSSVAVVGDVNGDGAADLLVGAPGNDSGANDSGAAYLFYGPVEPSEVSVADADVTFVGADAADRAGFAVAGGDVNGDGAADLLVGAPGYDTSDGESADDESAASEPGAVHVVYGGEEFEGTVSLADDDATLVGTRTGDLAGYSVATVPNATDDAAAVVVGAPGNDSDGNDSGAAYVLTDDLSDTVPLADAGTVLVGSDPDDRAGAAVSAAGDANGDDAPDVLVGAPYDDAGGNDSGAAYLVTEAFDAGTVPVGEAGARLVGANRGDLAGAAVAPAGDLNDDGAADLLVGAPRNDSGGEDAGAAYVLYGSEDFGDRDLAEADAVLAGASADDLAGSSLAAVEPACGDVPDLLVGAPGADAVEGETTGAAYLVAGENAEGTTNLSTATATFVGEGENDYAGEAVAAGDATDDGIADLLVGAPRNDSVDEDAGAAYLLQRECPTEAAEAQPTTTEESPTTEETTEPIPTTTAETTTTTTEDEPTATTTEEPTTTTATTTTTTTDEPFSPKVVFDCSQVTVEAASYQSVTLRFVDDTRRTFEGSYSGTETFAADDGKVVQSVGVTADGESFSANSPIVPDCIDNLQPDDNVDRGGDRRGGPPDKGERGGGESETTTESHTASVDAATAAE